MRRLKDELKIQKIANLEIQRKAKEERELKKKMKKSKESLKGQKLVHLNERVYIPLASEEKGLLNHTEK